MSRGIYEPGDLASWPLTMIPAAEGQRSVKVENVDLIVHSSGKPYARYLMEGMMERIVEDMHANVEEEFDNIVCVVGSEGTGKSHMSYHIGKSFDPGFDLSRSLVYSWKKFLQSVVEDPQKVYWFDEAVLVASGRDWMKESNKMLMQALQIIRSMRLTMIFCIPSFDNIDVYIRLFRTRYLLIVQAMKWPGMSEATRGFAEARVPKTKEERAKLPKDARAEDFFKPVGYTRFPKMPPEAKAVYDRMKAEAQRDALARMLAMAEESEGGSTRYRETQRRLERLVVGMSRRGMSYSDIAEVAGMSYNTVKNMVYKSKIGDDGE